MNQKELNKVAINYIEKQSIELASKIDMLLTADLLVKGESLDGPVIHHMHNLALYYSLVKLNSLFQITNKSKDAAREYCIFAESMKSKFLEMVESLQDFQPAEKDTDHE